MVVNIIVGFVTLLMAAFVVTWIFFPESRRWLEAPKVSFLERARRFPDVTRAEFSGQDAPINFSANAKRAPDQ